MKKEKCHYCGEKSVGKFLLAHRSINKVPKCKKCSKKNITGYSNLIFVLVKEGNRSQAILDQAIKERGETYFNGKYMKIEEFYNQLTIEQLENIPETEYNVPEGIAIFLIKAIQIIKDE